MIKLKYRQRPGRPRPDIDETLRSLKSDSHVIFFYVEDNQIVVVRILHENMSPAPRIAVGLSSLALRGE